MEKAKKFFEEIIKTEDAKALFASIEKPETDEARIAAYLEIAKKLNVELTVEDIIAYFKTAVVSAEVDDEELAQLTGGGDICSSTYENGEFCWTSDGCSIIINSYDNYSDEDKTAHDHSVLVCGKASYAVATNRRSL